MKRLAEEDSEFGFEESAQKVLKTAEEDPEAAARLFLALPRDALNTIALFLPLRTILNLCGTNTAFHKWCHERNNGLWGMIYERNYDKGMPLATLKTLLKTLVPAYEYNETQYLCMAMGIFDEMSLHPYASALLVNTSRTAALVAKPTDGSIVIFSITLGGDEEGNAARIMHRDMLPYVPRSRRPYKDLDYEINRLFNSLPDGLAERTVFSKTVPAFNIYFLAYLYRAMTRRGFRYNAVEYYDFGHHALQPIVHPRRLNMEHKIQCASCLHADADAGPCEHCAEFDRRPYCGNCYGHHQQQH